MSDPSIIDFNTKDNNTYNNIDNKVNDTKHYCYILKNNNENDINRTYNGYTTNPKRRIRQHNQEIKGGAIYTKKYGEKSWEMYCLIGGFPTKQSALQCEWRIKHPAKKRIRPKKYNNPNGRIIGLNEILRLDKFTSKTEITTDQLNLEIWIIQEYAYLLNDLPKNIKINVVDDIFKYV